MGMNTGMQNQNQNQYPNNNFFNNPSQLPQAQNPNQKIANANLRKNKPAFVSQIPPEEPSVNPNELGMDQMNLNLMQNNYMGYNNMNNPRPNQFMGVGANVNNNMPQPQGGLNLNGMGGQIPNPQLGLGNNMNQNNIQQLGNPQMSGGMNFPPMNNQINNMIQNQNQNGSVQGQGQPQNLKKNAPKVSSQIL